MLNGSLQGQYEKLLPRKKQDSIAYIKTKKLDSLEKNKITKDTLPK
jgi:hypothetical protein